MEREPKIVRMLFNDAMARAIVQGRKTVTRRPIEPGTWNPNGPEYTGESMVRTNSDPRIGTQAYFRTHEAEWHGLKLPCLPGDILIGRECWAHLAQDPEVEYVGDLPHGGTVEYRADHNPPLRKPGGWEDAEPGDPEMVHWRPSIHMPDWAARIRRRVVSVTVERVQDVTIQDAVREGFPTDRHGGTDARNDFLCAWDDIYINRGLASAVNPWVWRIEFASENEPAA